MPFCKGPAKNFSCSNCHPPKKNQTKQTKKKNSKKKRQEKKRNKKNQERNHTHIQKKIEKKPP